MNKTKKTLTILMEFGFHHEQGYLYYNPELGVRLYIKEKEVSVETVLYLIIQDATEKGIKKGERNKIREIKNALMIADDSDD